jgi:hypothetical protein
MVGIAPGQTARLNVVNVGTTTVPSVPCVLVLAFVDGDGKILEQRIVSLTSGKAAFLDLVMNGVPGVNRVQLRGVGYNPLLAAGSIPQPISCSLLPTLELFETHTGKTTGVVTDFVVSHCRALKTRSGDKCAVGAVYDHAGFGEAQPFYESAHDYGGRQDRLSAKVIF